MAIGTINLDDACGMLAAHDHTVFGPGEPSIKRLVAFAVLMESGDGILAKNPGYVEEKFWAAMQTPDPEHLLDAHNKEKYRRWMRRWQR